jgi:hypothetical protein
VTILAAGYFLLVPANQSVELDQSLTRFAAALGQPTVHIERKSLAAHERDATGTWIVDIGSSSEELVMKLDALHFERAAMTDQQELRRYAEESLNSPGMLREHIFFRGEMALGHGTICESLPCNIDVGVISGVEKVVITISKI